MQLRNYLLVLLVFSFLSGAPPLARAQQPANYPPSPGVPDAMYETQAMFGTFDAYPVNYEYDNSSELVNERLAALEAELSRLKLAEGGSSIAPGHSDSKMKITGRVHVDSWNFPEDSAGVNEIETEDPAWSPQDRFGFPPLAIWRAREVAGQHGISDRNGICRRRRLGISRRVVGLERMPISANGTAREPETSLRSRPPQQQPLQRLP